MSDETKVWTGYVNRYLPEDWDSGRAQRISKTKLARPDIPVVVRRIPEGAPEIDYGAEYRTPGGDAVRVVSPPVLDHRGWIALVRWDERQFTTFKLRDLTRIDPEPPVEFTEAQLEAVREAFRSAVPPVGAVSYRQYVEDGIARLRTQGES